MSLHCIAVDDDDFSLKIIQKLSEQVPCVDLRKTFNNALDAMVYIKKHKPDLVFLDINMPDINGLEIAGQIKEQTMVIFTTAYKEYAVDAFDVNALDYLVKPFDRERFYHAVCKADQLKIAKEIREKDPQQNQEWDQSIVIKAEYKNIQLKLSDILYIEALDNYVKIHTPEHTYVTLQNLKSISEVLDKRLFMRVHRSFIISLPKVDQYNSSKIQINGNEIPIGRTFLPEFRKSIKDKSVYQVN